MKATLIGIGLAIVVLIVGIILLINYLGLSGTRGGVPATPSPSPTPSTSSPVPTVKPTITSILPTPGSSATPVGVNFQMAITDIAGTGLTRTVTAQITNSGAADAHNAWAKVEVSSQGQRVRLSGQDFLRVDIGTIKAGVTVTKQVSLTFSITDGLKIQQNGAQFLLTINSDEGSQTQTYDYKP